MLKAKGQRSRIRLHVLGSCFKNLAFPCPQVQGTILIELKASKRPKRIHACIYSSAYSYLLSLVGQPSCIKTLRTLTNTRTCRFDMAPSCAPSCASIRHGTFVCIDSTWHLRVHRFDMAPSCASFSMRYKMEK